MSNKLRAAMAAAGVSREPSDPNFENVTLLLHGDGTNGAQNNTFLDSSTNNFTITRNGNTTQGTFSPYGDLWSNYFDGSSGLTYTGSPIATNQTNLTIESWVYPIQTPTFGGGVGQVVVDGRTSAGGSYWGFGLNTSLQVIWRWFDGATGFATVSSGSVALNQWSHIAVSVSSNAIKLFINGVQQSVTGTTTLTNRGGNVGYVSIGRYFTTDSFYGYISNVRLIVGTAVYTSNFTPSTTPLTAISGTSLLTCQSNRFIDNSSNNFAITVNGNTSVQPFSPFNPTAAYSPTVNGGSGYFDGSGDSLKINGTTGVSAAADFTYETWIYPTTVSPTYQQIAYGPSFIPSRAFQLLLNGATLYIWDVLSHQTAVVPNQWSHVALVRSSGTMRLYLNGIQSTGSTTIASTATITHIGNTGDAGTEPFNGYQSNVRFVSSALYTSNFTPSTTPLTAITNTSLLCNFTNAGIFDNAMKNDLETVGNAQISTSVKKYGTGSMYFDGSGDNLYGPKCDFACGTGPFTIEFWAYLNVANVGTPCDSWVSTAQGQGYWAYAFSASYPSEIEFYYDGQPYFVTSGANITTNTWYHCAAVRNGSTITVYVNGIAKGSVTYSGIFGRNSWIRAGNTFNGYIDDLRITKGAARYTANFTPPTQAFPNQ